MNEFEKAISDFISKRSDKPALVEICGELEDPEEVHRILSGSQKKAIEHPASTTITIPVASYAALIRAQTQLDFIQTAYHHNKYSIDDELYCVFGPRVKAEDEDA